MNLEEVCKKFIIGNNPLSIFENFITSYTSSFDKYNVNFRRI